MNEQDRLKKRNLVYGAGSAVAVLLVVGILILVNLLGQRYSVRWDLTRDKSQSLTSVTKALLSEVKKPLTLTAFFPEGSGERHRTKDLLQNFTHFNANITFQVVDPEREPLKAKEAGYRNSGNVLVQFEGRKQLADRSDEETLASAIRRVLNPEVKTIYFLVGHGERGINDNARTGLSLAKKALENEGYKVEELNLLSQAEVPAKAAAVVVPGPNKALFPNEVAALKTFLNRGGPLLVMLEPYRDGGLKDFLAGYGVGLDDGMILDMNQVTQAIGASAIMPLVMQYGPHAITRKFTNVVTIYPMARPLILNREQKEATLIPLATTTASSWEKLGQDWLKEGKGNFDPQKDKKGPFTLAVLAEVKLPEKAEKKDNKPPTPPSPAKKGKKADLVVFGNTDFAVNAYFNLSGNGDLFLNTVNFLAQEEKQIVSTREKKPQPLTLTGVQAWTLFVVSLGVLPLLMLFSGIWAYMRRRAQR